MVEIRLSLGNSTFRNDLWEWDYNRGYNYPRILRYDILLYAKCGEWITADEKAKIEMGCCKDQCTKLMSCGQMYSPLPRAPS